MKSQFRLLCALTLATLACSEDETTPTPMEQTPDAGFTNPDATPNTVDDAGMEDDAGMAMDAGFEDTGPADSGVIDPNQEPFRTLRDRTEFTVLGNETPRINIVVVGDGYRIEQLDDEYDDHLDQLNNMWSARGGRRGVRDVTQPFRHYLEYFNVHRIHVASNESGVDDPANNTEVDTALDGSLVCANRDEGPCHVDFAKVDAAFTNALSGSGITPHIRIVALNTTEPVGAVVQTPDGPLVIYGAGHGQPNQGFLARELALSQLAIMFGAGTETTGGGSYLGGEPSAVNLTSTSTSTKWARWFGYEVPNVDDLIGAVSVIEGGGGFDNGLYRPTDVSKLNNPDPVTTLGFNAVVRELIILKIYELLPILVDFSPSNEGIVDNPSVLDITPLSFGLVPDPGDAPTSSRPLAIEWRINGMLVAEQNGSRLSFEGIAASMGLSAGNHSVEARIQDATPWVRDPTRPNMSASVRWDVIYRP